MTGRGSENKAALTASAVAELRLVTLTGGRHTLERLARELQSSTVDVTLARASGGAGRASARSEKGAPGAERIRVVLATLLVTEASTSRHTLLLLDGRVGLSRARSGNGSRERSRDI